MRWHGETAEKGASMGNFIIIDGNSLINRAFYALPPLTGKNGKPTQAIYGFVKMLLKLREYNPTHMAVAFDLRAPTFRHKEFDYYKATRKSMPEDLAVQVPVLKDLLRAMKIAVIEKEGYEADDIIGTMAKAAEMPTYVVTGDRDSFQLIDDDTTVLFTKKGISELDEMTEETLKSAMGLTPSGVIEYKALAGDTSDNIRGVPGVGDKSAGMLIEKYGNVDEIYAHIDEISGSLKRKLIDGKQSCYDSRRLATICTHVPDLPQVKDCPFIFPFAQNVKDMFVLLDFKTLSAKADLFRSNGTAELEDLEKEVVENDDETDVIGFDWSDDEVCAGSKIYKIRRDLLSDGEAEAVVIERIKELCEDENTLKIVADGKSLMYRLRKYNVTLRHFFDVALAQYLIDMSMDYSSAKALIIDYDLSGNTAACLKRIYNIQSEKLKSLGMEKLYYDVELPLVAVLSDMEREGVKVDIKKLDELSAGYGVETAELTEQIYAIAGKTFNINSPKQLAEVLFTDLGVPYPQKSKSRSTGAEILEPLRNEYEIVALVLKYRAISKLKSVYLDGMKPLLSKDGVVHTEFKQMLTTTGRLSSVEPNLQNIPVRDDEGRKLRKIFVARERKTFVSADYSQIELRVMAHLSEDKNMVDAYINGYDIHSATAAQVFGVNIEDVTPAMRRTAKIVNFGIIYGISDYGLAKDLGIKPSQAREFITKYFETFPAVKEYLEKSIAFAKESGYACTIFGRRRYIPQLNSSIYMQRQFGERVAMNMPLQGTAADIIKIAMINVAKRLEKTNSKLILQIHDELIVEADEKETDEVIKILTEEMEGAAKLKVPLTASIGYGKTWYDCK